MCYREEDAFSSALPASGMQGRVHGKGFHQEAIAETLIAKNFMWVIR
jgi:hypothetical protein